MIKPVINFDGYRISNIELKTYESEEQFESLRERDKEISLEVRLFEEKDEAILKMESIIFDERNNRSLQISILGFFTVYDKENASEYLRVNGSAILFPYLRMIMSIVSSLDNENAIVLPAINTNSFTEDKQM
ncbi:hypothetical protein [Globicatella sanguinis]|uniref:hypothetical protein n=1 Tax=Globicatella sanguinis TaxID=13076 RepID=UPI002543EBB2|nr:hypothetical protein [Globicatella sanguinis]MDK7631756.1 hypothetical protein [Globicatella sanguinis]WIK66451.1 hypothetical protein CYJ72_011130 [Globicatella sanguinis]WKT55856.1 hypothetical protein Q3C38_11130 [Globicatella sanguinis]